MTVAKKTGYTPRGLAYAIALHWLRQYYRNYQSIDGDWTEDPRQELTAAETQQVRRAIAKLHNSLLRRAANMLEGMALNEDPAKED